MAGTLGPEGNALADRTIGFHGNIIQPLRNTQYWLLHLRLLFFGTRISFLLFLVSFSRRTNDRSRFSSAARSGAMAILQPYLATPGNARISQVYVNSSGVATIQWSEAATFPAGAQQATLTPSTRNAGDIVTTQVPAALLVKQTFLIWSEVSYLYKPAVGYVMVKGGVTLSDFAYSRPRQYTCLFYNTFIPPFTNPIANPSTNCPMS